MNDEDVSPSKFQTHGLGILLPLVMMWPAFLNGFPFVYSDTSTYLSAGFELETPVDRPMAYGLFIWLTSFGGLTLWTTVYAQSWLLCISIRGFIQTYFPKLSTVQHFVVILSLCLFSTMSWTSAQLMPDVFTPIMVLSLLSFMATAMSKRKIAMYSFLFFLSCCMHASHVSIAIVAVVVLRILSFFILRGVVAEFALRRYLWGAGLAFVSVFTMSSALAKSRSVFFMGAMAEHGILAVYLDEHCPGNLRLCDYKDSIPEKAYEFIWAPSGPVQRLGGFTAVNQEFGDMISETLTEPRYIGLHIEASAKATLEQLGRTAIGDGWGAFGASTLLGERLVRYVPFDEMLYLSSDQQRRTANYIPLFSGISYWFTALSVVAALFAVFGLKDRRMVFGVVAILLAVVVNAWSCGTFANAIDRLGCKMSWLICLAACLWFASERIKPSLRWSLNTPTS